MENEMMKKPESGQERENEVLDWEELESLRGELQEIFESFSRKIDNIKVMTEVAQERGLAVPSEVQFKIKNILDKFEPYGEHIRKLYKMTEELGEINTLGHESGILITEDEHRSKLSEIRARENKEN